MPASTSQHPHPIPHLARLDHRLFRPRAGDDGWGGEAIQSVFITTDAWNATDQNSLNSTHPLFLLPDSTIVYSGHGPETTVGAERRFNPFL